MTSGDIPDFTRIRPTKVRIRLPLTSKDVFNYISDPRNDPEWVDTTPRVDQVDGDGPVVGAVYEYDQTVGRDVTGTITITDIAAPSWMAFCVEDPLRVSRVEYHLRPTKRGDGCIMEQCSFAWYRSSRLRRWWMRPMVRFMVRRQLNKQLRMLRDTLA